MFKSNFSTSIWEKAKLVTALICIILMIYQLVMGFKMMDTNNKKPPAVTGDRFDSLTAGSEISGTITHVEGWFVPQELEGGTQITCFVVLSDTNHIMLFRTPSTSAIHSSLISLYEKKTDSVSYRGMVKNVSADIKSRLSIYMSSQRLKAKYNIKMDDYEAILGVLVDVTDANAGFSDKEIIVTFIGAALMVVAVVLLLRKTFMNAVVSFKTNNQDIDRNKLLKHDDYIFENEGFYNGELQNGEFFVNTDHNVRNEGKFEEEPEDLMTHMVSQGNFFYDGGTNEEGNFYIDSEKKVVTPYAKNGDTDNFLKKY